MPWPRDTAMGQGEGRGRMVIFLYSYGRDETGMWLIVLQDKKWKGLKRGRRNGCSPIMRGPSEDRLLACNWPRQSRDSLG